MTYQRWCGEIYRRQAKAYLELAYTEAFAGQVVWALRAVALAHREVTASVLATEIYLLPETTGSAQSRAAEAIDAVGAFMVKP